MTFVPQPPERRNCVVLQRALQLGDRHDVGQREFASVFAERLDDRAAEKVRAFQHERREGRLRAGILHMRGDCSRERRPDELRLLLIERRDE